ncbi:benzoate 4-monooxygenase cytochrome-like protein P450 [Westerdykella ornata]|uniref:Benzoate 4-monooxygenase cytochrome-like protein P450 n=1 Tax=Westerdykella ornata TaxID=318751 RepID=A0A6A6JG89_WESOR|nr:benzoate 4-monooxygenase cytochrome-like protein P450 [Westerdykella ornata]KAF2275234.1 benzoate 4-monooxygenase cytochrome-like protein P450 [Westerdykella ornata]
MELLISTARHLLSSPLLLVGSIFGALFLYLLLLSLYRLTLHPLARYPGPRLAALTDIYLAYHAYRGDRHLCYHAAHQKYGPVVRIGPNSLSFNTSSALKTIYMPRANVRKADFYTAFPANKHTYNVHSSIDKMAHARKRRVLSHAFSDAAIKSLEKYILANVRTGCRLLGEKKSDRKMITEGRREDEKKKTTAGGDGDDEEGWADVWNAANWANWLVFDIMGDLVFGKAFGMLEGPANRFAVELVGNAAHRHLICGTYLPLHTLHLDKLLFHHIASQRAQYMAYSKSQALERTRLGLDVDRRDFFYHLLQARDPETGAGFSMNELWGESNLLIIAGSDTTSTALAGTLFYLVHNAGVLRRLTAEIRNAFDDVEEIVSGPKLSNCVFLRACIDETLRMSPPVAGALPRRVLPGGITIDGHFIPEGIDVGVPHYSIHHNALYYPDPDAYRPERWLPDPESNPLVSHVQAAREAFCPFSIGLRGCIGKGLAYVELSVAIARVLYEYDVRLAPGTNLGAGGEGRGWMRGNQGEFQIVDVFASKKDGPLVQFRRRRDAEGKV